MRQIVIDTETTGLEPEKGHRIIEIGCVELIDRRLTGNKFHKYLNPGRDISYETLNITGITQDFLQDKPTFSSIMSEFLDFIRDAELIAHNASFDVGFINHEIRLINKKNPLLNNYVTIFDTLALARKKFPGQRNTLDAICKRYKIDLSGRTLHGALLDAELLAEAYLLMTGGQGNLFTTNNEELLDENLSTNTSYHNPTKTNRRTTLITFASQSDLNLHNQLLTNIKKSSGKCLWETNDS